MDREATIQYWLSIARYDLETAHAMQRTGRWLYVGFMCHQTIEKSFKGLLFARKGTTPPFSHNLTRIAQAGGFYNELDSLQKDLIDYLEPLNIEARYPLYREKLIKELSESRCADLLTRTEELFKWTTQNF